MTSGPAHRGNRRPRMHGGGAPEDRRARNPERRVRVTCPACGVVRVRFDDVVLRNCLDDHSWSYRARCSSCRTLFVAATPAALALPAIAAGLPVEQWTLPAPSRRHGTGPLREADALELHRALLRPGWIDELARELPPEPR